MIMVFTGIGSGNHGGRYIERSYIWWHIQPCLFVLCACVLIYTSTHTTSKGLPKRFCSSSFERFSTCPVAHLTSHRNAPAYKCLHKEHTGLCFSAMSPSQALQYLQNEGRLLQGTLDLSHNHLASLPFLRFIPSISSLVLCHNRMVALPSAVFNPLTGLQSLDLSNNKLEELPSR